jgi:phosphonate C-P lyase system protein PhnG
MPDLPDTILTEKLGPAIAAAGDDALAELAASLPTDEVEVAESPQSGLIMLTVTDAMETDFHLGEVLVTTAEVLHCGHRVHATVLGDCPHRAVLAATAAAALRHGDNATREAVRPRVERLVRDLDAAREAESRLAATTLVSFESMAKE